MTALRQRLLEDMQVRNYSPRTVEAYVLAVAKLAKHFGKSPDQLDGEELRAFQVHLLQAKASWSQFNQIVCGLRFFYGTSLGRAEVVPMLWQRAAPKARRGARRLATLRRRRASVAFFAFPCRPASVLRAEPRFGIHTRFPATIEPAKNQHAPRKNH